MDKVYALLIKRGLKTIEDVPEHLKERVEALLEDRSDVQAST